LLTQEETLQTINSCLVFQLIILHLPRQGTANTTFQLLGNVEVLGIWESVQLKVGMTLNNGKINRYYHRLLSHISITY
jgi:hypothetical protein